MYQFVAKPTLKLGGGRSPGNPRRHPLAEENGPTLIRFLNVEEVFDPSNPDEKVPAPNDMLAWLQEHPRLDAEEPSRVSIGGADGQQFEVIAAEPIDAKVCSEPCAPLFSFGDGNDFWLGESEKYRFIVLDDVDRRAARRGRLHGPARLGEGVRGSSRRDGGDPGDPGAGGGSRGDEPGRQSGPLGRRHDPGGDEPVVDRPRGVPGRVLKRSPSWDGTSRRSSPGGSGWPTPTRGCWRPWTCPGGSPRSSWPWALRSTGALPRWRDPDPHVPESDRSGGASRGISGAGQPGSRAASGNAAPSL